MIDQAPLAENRPRKFIPRFLAIKKNAALESVASGPLPLTEVKHVAVMDDDSAPKLRLCPDCGTLGFEAYCAKCGEALEPSLPTAKEYIRELTGEFISFDSKFIRTIPPLLFKPGFLTQEYIAGRRKRYLLPSRLYILVAFSAFFFLTSYVRDVFDKKIFGDPTASIALTNGTGFEVHKTIGPNQTSTNTRPGTITVTGPTGALVTIDTANFQRTQAANKEKAKPVIETLIRLGGIALPYILLLECSPIFALFLRWIYRKKKKLYVEHLIFTFHLSAFALIIFAISTVFIHSLLSTGIGLAVVMLYFGIALKRVYGDHGWHLAAHFIEGVALSWFIVFQAVIVALLVAGGIGWYFGYFPPGTFGSQI